MNQCCSGYNGISFQARAGNMDVRGLQSSRGVHIQYAALEIAQQFMKPTCDALSWALSRRYPQDTQFDLEHCDNREESIDEGNARGPCQYVEHRVLLR